MNKLVIFGPQNCECLQEGSIQFGRHDFRDPFLHHPGKRHIECPFLEVPHALGFRGEIVK